MRTLLLGKIRARRDGLAFIAEPHAELTALAGEEIEVAVAYEYDEPSLAQDHFQAVLRLEAPAGHPLQEERVVPDRPFTRDRETGLLSRRITVQGPLEGRYEVRAALGSQPWSLHPPTANGAQIEESGAFRVRVR